MIRRVAFADLAEALIWLREVWEAREVPLRLHERRAGDDGAPRFSPAFARLLNARADDVTSVSCTRTCHHLRLPKAAVPWDCPDCVGRGVYETEALVYRYPTWRAMTLLRRANLVAHDSVLTLVINGFDVAGTCSVLCCSADGLLAAIRALHSRYALAPVERASSIEQSNSPRKAETRTNGALQMAPA